MCFLFIPLAICFNDLAKVISENARHISNNWPQYTDCAFSGGPGQMAHLAPTYAAVMALASLQIEEALASIDLYVVLSIEIVCPNFCILFWQKFFLHNF